MANLDDELALFESELAELEQTSTSDQNDTHVGYQNATISAGPTSSEPLPPQIAPPLLAAQPFVPIAATIGGSPFLNPGLGRIPTMPPVPPSLFMPPQLRAAPMIFPPRALGIPAPAIIEGAPALYETPAVNTIPQELLRTQALQSDIDKMNFKKQTDPFKKRSKNNNRRKTEWDENDFRVFCGDLGNEVSDELLAKAFRKYPSFQKAKVVRESRTNKSKGYGFVSFRDSEDYVRAMREMDGKYVGNRPIKLRKSAWKERNIDVIKQKRKQKKELGIL
uniref:RNA-binding protein 42 n=1 Tax=Caenorhabditis tropicalis TaxID=1561998 RepID=A0A1I7TWK6_9PELO